MDLREWLETNGLGGFASSTVAGVNTRRYHGLLTVANQPPAGRVLMLSKLEETVVAGGRSYELSANQYPGVVHPRGFEHLKEFRRDPMPTWVYECGDENQIEKRVFMVHGENTTVISYEWHGPGECTLELRPLVAFRDYHALTHQNAALNPALIHGAGWVRMQPYPDLPALYLCHDDAEIEPAGDWYLNFEYAMERERGLDFQEDLFHPLTMRFHLSAERPRAVVIASKHPHDARTAPERRVVPARSSDPFIAALTAAADQFIVRRGDLRTIVAGYHWFTDWGRDTMIALPGLTLTTGRYDVARQILQVIAQHMERGMLPNRFADAGGAAEYNSVDAALWFVEAVRAYLAATDDLAFVRDALYPKLQEFLEWHLRGTHYGIGVDSDGLLACGEPGVQLTWMDAKIGDWVVTPREGKPVEIQALWYNALRVLEDLARRFGDSAAETVRREWAERARDSFNAQFWHADADCLYDVVARNGTPDAKIRPNQIFAVSLPHSMLAPDRARRVVDTVTRELLTPLGLRTLSPRDPEYCGQYTGGPRERDSAYHQGTVWLWLMGPYLTAYRKVSGQQGNELLEPFRDYLNAAGLGQLPEIADGDAPHHPRGCIAQAWSVAEILRVAT